MHSLYAFVSGPLAWAAFILFFGGSLLRLVQLVAMVHRKERFVYSYMSLGYSLRSILHWITPFGTANWRRHPVLTVATFAFHIAVVVTPIFLLAHVVLIDEAFDLRWPTLPEAAAVFMSLVAVGCAVFFFVRRLVRPEVRYVTTAGDFLLLALVAAPFVTGLLAYYQWFGTELMTILHILSGEAMLVAIPFSRLSHMLYAPLTRAYMGSEFGAVRHAHDW